MARLSMLIDLTRCIGCDACTVACKQENGTPKDVFFARVLNVEQGSYPDVRRVYIPVLCNHCENPACLKACPNKAIFRRDDGIVLVDQDRCRGTGACVSACPYGNIILSHEPDQWYLPDDRAYEREYVKPRLNPGVARKCTLCAHRVDEGLKPACVVACPTTARIFGDLEDPESDISVYAARQKEETHRDPFKLLPEAGTEPATLYLGTMAAQKSSIAEQPARTEVASSELQDPVRRAEKPAVGAALRTLILLLLFLFAARPAAAQNPADDPAMDVWSSSSCAGCHGAELHGGFGPPLASTKLDYEKFHTLVRQGKGMMPATPASELSDEEVKTIFQFARGLALDPKGVPTSYKVAGLFKTRNVGIAFMIISLIAFLLSLKVLAYWVDCSGVRELRPAIARFGYGKAAWIVLRSLIVDGLLVASLWRTSRGRWAMHGLLLYGFLALGLADMLMSIFNPTRGALPLSHPLKLLPNLGGLAVLLGIAYVRIRYRTDPYIDNGLTIGRDYLFLNLLTLTIVSGFATEFLGYAGKVQWVLPVYMVHLVVVAVLFVSAPFTRFMHAFVVPVMAALTRLTEELVKSGVEPGFVNEPAPGRHHKSHRIAGSVLAALDPSNRQPYRLRYYP